MKHVSGNSHTITFFSSVLLTGGFLLLLLLLLLFSAEVYHANVNAAKENDQLRTAMSYLTTKLRQHDSTAQISIKEVGNFQALCLTDNIEGLLYTTYIYLDGTELKELFTASDVQPEPSMGNTLTQLTQFNLETVSSDLYQVLLTDSFGHSGMLYFHAGPPG